MLNLTLTAETSNQYYVLLVIYDQLQLMIILFALRICHLIHLIKDSGCHFLIFF